MLPWSTELKGHFDEHVVESEVLRGNPLGDPHLRPLWVYVPPGYDEDAERRYPSVYVLQGLTGQLDMWRNRVAFRRNFPELVDQLAAPCLVVFVDAWTSLGGSQFIDSPGTGRYGGYLCNEVVAFVDERYRTLAEPAHRGVMGHSSGGYGAMVSAMLRPDRFGAFATHSGDALFEVCYLPDFRDAARALRDHYDGSFERFWADFRSRPAFTRKTDYPLLNAWCMAACYSTDEDGTVQLPFVPETGELVPMVARHPDALRGLRGIWIDAGTRDEAYLDLGAEAFRRALADIGVTDVAFELFDATHMGIEYRYPVSLKYLAERLT